ncbi:MAG: archaellin/type IV pilin N-terminal domain-containing protein [Nanoarchaeota archaeon]|nr:archaellin/type IV pilin N-terminal domain-containing protein [Nanoarchaeota archaeon]
MKNKRGVSGVITTVLLILIVVGAVGLLWVAIKPMFDIDDPTTELDCLKIDLKIKLAQVIDSGFINVDIENKGYEGFSDVQITLLSDTDTLVSFNKDDDATGNTGQHGIFNLPKRGEITRFNNYLDSSTAIKIEKVRISAIIGEHTCKFSDEVVAIHQP